MSYIYYILFIYYISVQSRVRGWAENRSENKTTYEFLVTPHMYTVLGTGDRS